MAVPKQHDSKSKVGKRRSQKNLKKLGLVPCEECKAPKASHKMCANCGYYPKKRKSQGADSVNNESQKEKAAHDNDSKIRQDTPKKEEEKKEEEENEPKEG